MPKRVDEQALFEPEWIAKYQRNVCIPAGAGYKSPGVCCDGNGSVPGTLLLMPVPTDREADSERDG